VRTDESFETLVSENPVFDHRNKANLMAGLSVDAAVAAAEALLVRTRNQASEASNTRR